MTGKQAEFELQYSRRLNGDMLKHAIRKEFSNTLETWVLGAYLRLIEYFNGEYYPSKLIRVMQLQNYLADKDWYDFFATLLMTVIRRDRDQTIQQVVGALANNMPHDDVWDNLRTAGEVLAVCSSKGGVYELVRTDKHDQPIVQVNHWTTIRSLFETELEWISDTHSNPPLKERPRKVKNNFNAGYHTIKEPLVLGKFTQHQDYLSYDVLNILNGYKWRLDPDIRGIGERPPDDLVSPEEIQNFHKHAHQAQRIYEELGEDPFYLVWQFDSRGRIYSHGHHVQFQSYEYKKALLSFDHFEYAT